MAVQPAHRRKRLGKHWHPKQRGNPKWKHHPVEGMVAAAAGIVAAETIDLEEIFGAVNSAFEALLVADAIEAAGLPEDAPVEAGTLLATIVVGLILFVLAIVLIFLLVGTLFLRTVISNIPLIGSYAKKVTDPIITVIKSIMHTLWSNLEMVAGDFWHGAVLAVMMLGQAAGLDTVTDRQTQVYGLEHDLTTAWSKLYGKLASQQAHERIRFRHVWSKIHMLESFTGNQAKELHGLKVDIQHLRHSVRQLDTAATRLTYVERELTHRLNRQHRQLTHIEVEITSIREQLKAKPSPPGKPGGLTHKQAHELHYAHNVAVGLAPLLALLPLTIARVGNLRKLEDKPCQCPQLPGSGDPLVPALVADFALKDGV